MSRETSRPSAAPRTGGPPQIDSRALFGAAREVVIHHAGQAYRLRHTATGKLILTK